MNINHLYNYLLFTGPRQKYTAKLDFMRFDVHSMTVVLLSYLLIHNKRFGNFHCANKPLGSHVRDKPSVFRLPFSKACETVTAEHKQVQWIRKQTRNI